MRFEFGGLLLGADLALAFVHVAAADDVADFVIGVAGVQDLDFVDHRALDHLAVGALDESVLVDLREARERRDQTDVRSFRRLNRANAAVVGRVNVADFEAGALTGQTAGSKGRQTALVGDLARAGWSDP